jgi:hypothetical protein
LGRSSCGDPHQAQWGPWVHCLLVWCASQLPPSARGLARLEWGWHGLLGGPLAAYTSAAGGACGLGLGWVWVGWFACAGVRRHHGLLSAPTTTAGVRGGAACVGIAAAPVLLASACGGAHPPWGGPAAGIRTRPSGARGCTACVCGVPLSCPRRRGLPRLRVAGADSHGDCRVQMSACLALYLLARLSPGDLPTNQPTVCTNQPTMQGVGCAPSPSLCWWGNP